MDAKNRLEGKKGKAPNRLWEFLKETLLAIISQRRWLLLPLWVLMAILAILLALTGNSALLPAIYIAF
jgi:hypothetical protein